MLYTLKNGCESMVIVLEVRFSELVILCMLWKIGYTSKRLVTKVTMFQHFFVLIVHDWTPRIMFNSWQRIRGEDQKVGLDLGLYQCIITKCITKCKCTKCTQCADGTPDINCLRN